MINIRRTNCRLKMKGGTCGWITMGGAPSVKSILANLTSSKYSPPTKSSTTTTKRPRDRKSAWRKWEWTKSGGCKNSTKKSKKKRRREKNNNFWLNTKWERNPTLLKTLSLCTTLKNSSKKKHMNSSSGARHSITTTISPIGIR